MSDFENELRDRLTLAARGAAITQEFEREVRQRIDHYEPARRFPFPILQDELAGGRTRRVAVASALLLTSVAFVVVGALAGFAHRGGTEPLGRGHESVVASNIDTLAVQLAASYQDSSPSSVTWVASTRQDALSLWGIGNGVPATPVYVLEISGGSFSDSDSGGIPGGASPASTSSRYLVAIVTQSSLSATTSNDNVTDIEVAGSVPSLNSLGTPVTDPLS
jgi:hypothetical protein